MAQTLLEGRPREAYLIVTPDLDLLPLLIEAQALLPADRRWQSTFSTYWTKLPANVTCLWRCVLADSPEAHLAHRAQGALRLDLTRPLGEAPPGPLVELARTGKMAASAIGRGVSAAGALPASEAAPPPLPSARSIGRAASGAAAAGAPAPGAVNATADDAEYRLAPPPRPLVAPPAPLRGRRPQESGRPHHRTTQALAVALTLLLSAGIGAAAWWAWDRSRQAPEVASLQAHPDQPDEGAEMHPSDTAPSGNDETSPAEVAHEAGDETESHPPARSDEPVFTAESDQEHEQKNDGHESEVTISDTAGDGEVDDPPADQELKEPSGSEKGDQGTATEQGATPNGESSSRPANTSNGKQISQNGQQTKPTAKLELSPSIDIPEPVVRRTGLASAQLIKTTLGRIVGDGQIEGITFLGTWPSTNAQKKFAEAQQVSLSEAQHAFGIWNPVRQEKTIGTSNPLAYVALTANGEVQFWWHPEEAGKQEHRPAVNAIRNGAMRVWITRDDSAIVSLRKVPPPTPAIPIERNNNWSPEKLIPDGFGQGQQLILRCYATNQAGRFPPSVLEITLGDEQTHYVELGEGVRVKIEVGKEVGKDDGAQRQLKMSTEAMLLLNQTDWKPMHTAHKEVEQRAERRRNKRAKEGEKQKLEGDLRSAANDKKAEIRNRLNKIADEIAALAKQMEEERGAYPLVDKDPDLRALKDLRLHIQIVRRFLWEKDDRDKGVELVVYQAGDWPPK